MDSSVLAFGNSSCHVLSLQQHPGMLAGTGQPNNIDVGIDIEVSVFTVRVLEQCGMLAMDQQRWLCHSAQAHVLILVWFTSMGVAKVAICDLEVPTHNTGRGNS